eukprot:365661-Chlamydomonas_euryale.AAC.39
MCGMHVWHRFPSSTYALATCKIASCSAKPDSMHSEYVRKALSSSLNIPQSGERPSFLAHAQIGTKAARPAASLSCAM